HVDIASRKARVLDKSGHSRLDGVAWSPDGRWLAYGFAETRQTSAIRLCEVATGEAHTVTRPVLHDGRPAFDPDGKYLYFLSYREFNPVYDNLHFDLNFPWGMRPHLVALQDDAADPFKLRPEAPGSRGSDGNGKGEDDKDDAGAKKHEGEETEDDKEGGDEKGKTDDTSPPRLVIDIEGIADRVAAFPVTDARYGQIVGLKGKVLFTKYILRGTLDAPWQLAGPPPARGHLMVYDFSKQDTDELLTGVTSFMVSLDGKTLMYRSGNSLRAIKAGAKPGEKSEGAGPKNGWLSLGRVKVSVDPAAEWRQMLREAWRLQRDQFWVPDMSGVDWEQVYERYAPLVDRVATRSELSDLLWEMQGELGTSHAYEFGGDYRPEPAYQQGLLGADLRYDPKSDAYEIVGIVAGDRWKEGSGSPLGRLGSAAAVGEHIVAVNGRGVGAGRPPAHYLVNQAGEKVDLTLRAADGSERTVTVKTLTSEVKARYREWVEGNRRFVAEATGGRVGYIHVPDMSAAGYAEFHRGFLPQVDSEGLIVDVRYNGGGHVSQLLLEKLARRRIGYDIQRWGEPVPYPYEAVMGPLVAVTNEAAGSDGDMFSHAFKLMGLGPLVGKRTWGGVIGISVRDSLVDGGVTTQPEFSFWFEDVGYGLENYGAEPDIEVDIRPQDYAAGHDTQLQKAVEVILELLAENPPNVPDFGRHPSRALPTAPEGNAKR
ncbi:MAG: S41 family peptidase, partial [Anaerolineae bacterium]